MSAFRNILVPVDFSDCSSAAIERAVEFAGAFGARLHVLHSYEMPLVEMTPYHFAVPQSVWDEVREAAQKRLSDLRADLAAKGVEVEEHLRQGVPSEAIAGAADELEADLIVMGTHGHTGLTHMLLGSVAERTVRTAPCPVLTVKSG